MVLDPFTQAPRSVDPESPLAQLIDDFRRGVLTEEEFRRAAAALGGPDASQLVENVITGGQSYDLRTQEQRIDDAKAAEEARAANVAAAQAAAAGLPAPPSPPFEDPDAPSGLSPEAAAAARAANVAAAQAAEAAALAAVDADTPAAPPPAVVDPVNPLAPVGDDDGFPGAAGPGDNILGAGAPGVILEELSGGRGDRQRLFQRFLSAQGQGQVVPPLLRGALTRRFNPLSALFALQRTLQRQDPETGEVPGEIPANFQSFLTNRGLGQRPTGGEFGDIFKRFREMFGDVTGGGLDPQALGAIARLTGSGPGQDVGRNIISSTLTAGLNPFLARATGNQLQRAMDAFLFNNPAGNLFQRFAERGFRGF